MTLLDFLNVWLETYAMAHCKRWKGFKREFELYLAPLQDYDLEAIRKADVMRLQTQLVQTKGKSAANTATTLLSMLYNKAIEWEYFEGKSPAARIRKFKIEPRERFLQPEELPRFLDSVMQLRHATTRDFFLMLLFTGQRRRNVAEMRWRDVDLVRQTWRIPSTKNGTSHTLPLVEEAVNILKRRQGKDPEWVFPREDGKGPLWCRYTAWLQVLKRAQIVDLRMHDLRRSLASWQAITGASLPIIGKTLNHKSSSATQIYARLHLDPVRSAMEIAVTAMLSQSQPDLPNR